MDNVTRSYVWILGVGIRLRSADYAGHVQHLAFLKSSQMCGGFFYVARKSEDWGRACTRVGAWAKKSFVQLFE